MPCTHLKQTRSAHSGAHDCCAEAPPGATDATARSRSTVGFWSHGGAHELRLYKCPLYYIQMHQLLIHTMREVIVVAVVSALWSCGGRSSGVGDIEAAAGATANSSSNASGGTGGGDASQPTGGATTKAAAGGNVGTPDDAGVCVAQTSDAFSLDTCNNLGRLIVRNPLIMNSSGSIEPGDSVSLSVTLVDISGFGYNEYPGVIFQSGDAGVTFDGNGRSFNSYALLSCQSTPVTTTVHLASSIPLGTVVHVMARAASLNRDCPDAPFTMIPITVG